MSELLIAKMLNKRFEISVIRGYKNSNIKVSVFLKTQSKIISFSKNLNTVGYITNSTNKFLIRSWSGPSASNLTVKACSNHQTDTKLISSLSISSCDRPHHVTSSVPHSLTYWVTSFFLLVNKWILHQWVNLNEFLGWDKVSSDKFSNSQTNSMLDLRWWRDVQNIINNI